MYEFHYDVMLKKYGDDARLLFTDTDSLCYHIFTADIYDDMMPLRDTHFDTSDYPKDHKLFSLKNKKVPGLMKDEGHGVVIEQFVGLKAKQYSILSSDASHSKMTAKGVKKCFVKNHVRHEMYVKTLHDRKCTYANFVNFRSRCHKIESVNIHKICLNAYDDKRYVCVDGVSTLAYGHYSLRKPSVVVEVVE
jgi:hypothetical protein